MRKKVTVITACLLILSVSIFALFGNHEKASEGLEFTALDDNTASVSGIGECKDQDIVIPSKTPDGKKVTAIADNAFEQNRDIRSVVIPDTVTDIGQMAFKDSYITDVRMSDSVTSIGHDAFRNCIMLHNVTLSGSLTVIADRTFADCKDLRTIDLPPNLMEIRSGAFMGCAINEITIPDSVQTISSDAFYTNPLMIINGEDSLEWCERTGFHLNWIHYVNEDEKPDIEIISE
ncbi:MAG: leucine-rich repeat domain-containing protein [Clostridiales bacterium]|nr:leucine-rich repeat domain-containing protein [Clostridiales bacterium]